MIFKTLLVDDESLALQRLQKLLKPYPEFIDVIGTATTGEEAVTMINQQRPDLVFLDIQMPGMNGFEVVASLEHQPLIVFSTAYDQYALEAFEVNSIDYLLKPIESVRLQKTIEKLQKLTAGYTSDLFKQLEAIIPKLQQPKAFWIHAKTGDKIHLIHPNDVYFFTADEKYVRVHTYDKDYLINQSLGTLEKELSESFVRIHRASLVNLQFIDEIYKMFKGNYKLRMKDVAKTELSVSRQSRHRLGIN